MKALLLDTNIMTLVNPKSPRNRSPLITVASHLGAGAIQMCMGDEEEIWLLAGDPEGFLGKRTEQKENEAST